MNDPNCTSDTLISLLVTLYAIVPSIIITVMYSFLSTIEGDLASFAIRTTNDNFNKRVVEINTFVVISSKVFHLSMAYYLMQLFGALFSKCLSWIGINAVCNQSLTLFVSHLDKYINISAPEYCIMSICSEIYFIYFGFYFYYDVRGGLNIVLNHDTKQLNIPWYKKNRFVILPFLFIVYGLLPLLLTLVYSTSPNCNTSLIHLCWITLTIFHILIWWLWMPWLYKPLTHLAYIKKNIDSLRRVRKVKPLAFRKYR